jgi:hypothetical protein
MMSEKSRTLRDLAQSHRQVRRTLPILANIWYRQRPSRRHSSQIRAGIYSKAFSEALSQILEHNIVPEMLTLWSMGGGI